MSHALLRTTLVAALLAGLMLPATVRADQQLIVNGNFEKGDFTGFRLTNQKNPSDTAGADHFYVSTPGSDTPAVNGMTFTTASNPAGGQHYAVTSSDLPGAHALLQNFIVPVNTTRLTLTFQMFVNDQLGFGPIIDPTGLDYTTGGTYNDNQFATVDILKAGAGDLSTSSTDVVDNLYQGVDPSNFDSNFNLIPNPYTNYSFDLTGILTPGDSYVLRFAEVDNLGAINLGVDNIRLTAAVQSTPEPGTVALVASLICTGSGLLLRRRRACI